MSKKEKTVPVNEIDQTIAAGTSFVERNLKTLVATIGGVVAIVIICLLTNQYYIQPQKEKAADNIAVAQQLFMAGNYEQALNGDGTNAGFLQIIDEFGSTPSGNIARLYAGLCYVQTEKFEDAVKYLEDYDECDDQMVSNAAIAALGNCYAQLGQNEKAASALLKAAKRADGNTLSPLFYLQAGQIYEALGNKAEALKCYETIKNEYPQSIQRQDIDKYIERVK